MLTEHEAFGLSTVGKLQVLVWLKSPGLAPVKAMALTLSAWPPLLTICTICVGLGVFSSTFPKESESGNQAQGLIHGQAGNRVRLSARQHFDALRRILLASANTISGDVDLLRDCSGQEHDGKFADFFREFDLVERESSGFDRDM